jgi:hypothetical protein
MRQLFDRPRATNGYGRNSRSFYQRTKNRSDGRDVLRYPLWVMKMPGFLVVPEAVRVGSQRSPFARLVILVEAGTHLIFDALICPYKMGERVRALKLWSSVMPGMLLMWDRGLHSDAMVSATVSKGCEYLGFIPSNVKFLNETQLDDGSYVSWRFTPDGKLRKKGFKPIQVRVIEYTIENYDRPEAQIRYRLITSLLDAEKFTAQLLACEYHQPWEVENTIDEIKVHL